MEAYAAVLSYAIPGFIVLIIVEYAISRYKKFPVNRAMDTISSLSSGMTNTLKELIGLSVVIISYSWMVKTFALYSIQSEVWLYIFAFILIDFAAYWSHRFNHSINVMWNRHIVHHSSEEYNLSCALRQSISGIIGVYFFLLIPMAIIGIPAIVVAITAPLHLFAQFWYHTRLIGKMGILEKIIVTPSHHRVHHAINPEYIDKNYAAIFIIWDKLFGSFQEEKESIPPVYGVKRPVHTWNPILINYQHMWQLFKDTWYAKSWWDKMRLWFMPNGWRPKDVVKLFPINVVNDVYDMKKYESLTSNNLKFWSWFQLGIHNILMYYILIRIGDFHFTDIVFYVIFLFVSIFAYTSLMDRHIVAVPAEFIKTIIGFLLIYKMDGWYLADNYLNGTTFLISIYLVFSLGITLYFTFVEKTKISTLSMAGS